MLYMSNILRCLSSPSTREGRVLYLASWYFFLCGVSAIALPEAWYVAAGISSMDNNTVLAVTGAMMLGLASGGFLATIYPEQKLAVSFMMGIASSIDLFVVVHAAYVSSLPIVNSLAFVLVDLGWCIALTGVFRCALRSSAPSNRGAQ